MIGVTMHPPPALLGRTDELEILRQLIAGVRDGRSAVVVVRGEAGIGKTELLDALIAEAARDFTDYQQLTAAGKLAEAGEKLERLKRTLEQLQTLRH